MDIKLLIVDDAPFIREVLRQTFRIPGLVIVGEAFDGEEAVRLARDLKPDVILMDLVMPKKSGIEAAQEILKENANVRIVACSTVDQNQMVLRALDAGCCGFVTKPFKAEDIIKAVRTAARPISKEAGV